MPHKPLANHINQAIIALSGLLVLSLGVSVLAGLHLYEPAFIQIEPTYFRMANDTALSFSIISVGLLGALYQRKYIARVAAVAVLIINSVTLVQVFLQTQFSFADTLLFLKGDIVSQLANRKVLLTAVSFILAALVIWSAVWETPPKKRALILASWVGALLPSIGFLCLFGYVIHIDTKHVDGWGILAPMATDTAMGFVVLGVGITAFSAYASQWAGIDIKKSSPILITIFVSFIFLIFWRALLVDEHLESLSSTWTALTIIKELGFASLVGVSIYFAQKSHYYAKRSKHLLALAKSTLEASANGLLVIDCKQRIVGRNKKLLTMWAVPDGMYSETRFNSIIEFAMGQLENPEEFAASLADIQIDIEKSSTFEMRLKNGLIFEFYSFPEYLDSKVIGRVFSFHDITGHKQIENKLLYQATHDVLTGLANRFLLLDHIEQVIGHEKRRGGLLAVLFFDLDRFKPINDSLGHAVGDLLLKAVASRLKSHTRDGDTLARLGGDEFVLLATDLNKDNDVLMVAERYIQALALPFQLETHELHLKCSIGISVYPKDGTDAATLLKNADIAMYKAKKNELHFQFFTTQMQEQVANRLSVEHDLRYALERNELLLFYQPIVNIESRKISAVEALIRWRHPTRGLIEPSEFIAVAEESGMIVDVGQWVLRAACQQLKSWQERGIFMGSVCVNVSEKQLKQPDFHLQVTRVINEVGIDPACLELELTETALMSSTHTIDMLKKLKDMKVNLAVDDFGTGYSNLSYLKNLPVDKLKIDRAFVKDIPENKEDKAIVLMIIAMAKILSIRVLAEGVETPAQLKYLHENWCDEIQGYYFSRPMEAAEFEQSITAINAKISQELETIA